MQPVKDAVAIAFDRSLELLERLQRENATCTGNPRRRRWWPVAASYDAVGIFVQPHRLFLAGDVVFGWFGNGQAERMHVGGYSSKKRALVGDLMSGYARFRSMNKGRVHCLRHGPSTYFEHWLRHRPCHAYRHLDTSSYENRTRLRIARWEVLDGNAIRESAPLAHWSLPAVRETSLSSLRAVWNRAHVGPEGDARRERAPDAACPVRTDSGASAAAAAVPGASSKQKAASSEEEEGACGIRSR